MKKASIAICFSESKDKVLLVKRKDVPIWVLPGGGIENNETPEHAATRELEEETGVPSKVVRRIAIYHPINRLTSTTFVFECHPQKLDNLGPKEETAAVQFFPIDNLPTTCFFLHRDWIFDALEPGGPFEKHMSSITWSRLFIEAVRHPILVGRYLFSRLGLPINK